VTDHAPGDPPTIEEDLADEKEPAEVVTMSNRMMKAVGFMVSV
jgi:hypothetical protein